MKKYLKMIIVVFLAVFLFKYLQTSIYAKSNKDYFSPAILTQEPEGTEGVSREAEEITAGDTIMSWIGRFIYSVASMTEMLITNFSKWLFKIDCFPWEDYIVFNSLPYLDVNFFNAEAGSIFKIGADNTVGDMINTIYFSLLTLSVTILGIGVSVTAIRLAISSIAAEKAKYKEAITKCLYTVIMLFCVHFLISFIFYLNETIVAACSTMLKNLINNEAEEMIDAEVKNIDTSKISLFIEENANAIPTENSDLWKQFYHTVYYWNWNGIVIGNYDYYLKKYNEVYSRYYAQQDKILENAKYGCELEMLDRLYALLIEDVNYTESERIDLLYFSGDLLGAKVLSIEHPDRVWWSIGNVQHDVDRLIDAYINYKKNKSEGLPETSRDTLKNSYNQPDQGTKWYAVVENCYDRLIKSSEQPVPNVVSGLAELFKSNAYYNDLDKGAKQIDYVCVILYAIFIVQSLVLLINYIKRLFFVTLLSLLAPIVIIYDFFIGNNKVFTVWLKELCSLVFVQSIQALLFTIMLTLVVRLYVTSVVENKNVAAQQAMGVYAIIVMTVIPKVELLVKKIFGLGSGVMDDSMMGGKNSLLKTGLAVKMGMHGINNAGKVIGGIAGLASTTRWGIEGKKARIAENNMLAANADKEKARLMNENPQLVSSQNNRGNTTSRNTLSRSGSYNLDDLTAAIKNANAVDPEEKYAKAKHELNQKKLESLKQLTSGVAETVGYVGGAAIGGMISLGTGGDDLLSDMAIAAGTGDKIGKTATEIPFNTASSIENKAYNRKSVNKDLKASKSKVDASIKAKKEYEAAVAQIKASSTKNKTSKDLSATAKQYYDKAQVAKNQGNMEEYKKNRELAAAVMKGENAMKNPNKVRQSSTSSSTVSSNRDKAIIKSIARQKKSNIQSGKKIHGSGNNPSNIKDNINSIDGM